MKANIYVPSFREMCYLFGILFLLFSCLYMAKSSIQPLGLILILVLAALLVDYITSKNKLAFTLGGIIGFAFTLITIAKGEITSSDLSWDSVVADVGSLFMIFGLFIKPRNKSEKAES
jgi:membrane-bound ClpP family serine protease